MQVFRGNVVEMELPSIECVNCDVLSLERSKWHRTFDTVIMNPPFGTKQNAGIDMKFLAAAMSLSRNVVYSLHKSSTRDFIEKKVNEWNFSGEVIAELRYNLDASYKFHKKATIDIAVDCWRFYKGDIQE